MKFIHTADLHLGAGGKSKLPPEKARIRRRELLDTFRHIAELAEREGAAVLIAGDLFDSPTPSAATLSDVLTTVRRHAGVRFLCLPGNHDGERFPTEDVPENLTLFGDTWQCVTVGDTDVYGIAPHGDIPYGELTTDPARKNIVLLHGGLKEGGSPEAGAVLLSALAGRGIDYLALGHYHSYSEGRLDARGVYAYAGTPEGRGMDEAGDCGVLLIDTDTLPVAPRFRKIAMRTVHRLSVALPEGGDPLLTEQAIARAVSGIDGGDLVRIELVGRRSPDLPAPDCARLTALLCDRFFHFEVKDTTRLDIRPEDYVGSLTLKGMLVDLLAASEPDDAMRDEILTAALAALRGEEDEI